MRFLGNIVIPAAASRNNLTTASPFSIPFSCVRVALVLPTEASGFNVRVGTGSSLASDATQFNQVGPMTLQVALQVGTGVEQVVAIFSAGAGGTVGVYDFYGLNQS